VFSFGVYVLAFLAACLLIAFEGVADRLIPLFAVGAFMAFTLSQAGMVMHWRRTGGRGAFSSMLINGIGALTTGCTTCVVIVAKFTEGAWITVLAIPGLVWLMSAVHHHYRRIEGEADSHAPAHLKDIPRPIVILPLGRWGKVSEKALQFAYTLSRDLVVVHIAPKDQDGTPLTDDLRCVWEDFVDKPAREAGFKPPELVILHSPYRLVTTPIFRCTRDGAQVPRPADCRTRSGTRGVAVVLLFSSQSACDCPESASLCKRNAADNRDQRAVVCAVLSQGVLPRGSAVCQVISWSHPYAQKPRGTAVVARLPADWLTPPRIENKTPLHQHRIEGGISSYHCNPLATTEHAPA
jgi:hypothetical protein